MPFSDPILAGETLVRTAIASADYTVDNDGAISGWRIARDGSAEFRNVTIGGTAYTIDNEGNAAVETLEVNTAITLAGEDLAARLDALPRGCLAVGNSSDWTVDSASTSSTTSLLVARFDFGPLYDDRVYRYHLEYELVGTVAGDVFRTTIRYTTDGTNPATTSGILDGGEQRITIPAGKRVRVQVNSVWRPSAPYDVMKSAVVIARASGTGTALVELSDPNTSLRASMEDVGLRSIATENAQLTQKSKASGVPDPDPVSTYTKTYNATWSRSWTGSDSTYETNGTLAQGYNTYYTPNGNMKSWIGFDYSQIQSDLTGATVKKVEVYLYFWHWYSAAGGTAVLGYHNSTATSAPSYDASKDAVDEERVSGWGRNVGKWVDITSSGLFTADGWRTGAHRGIVIGPGPSTSTTYYGKAYGNTESNEPKLRITYEK